MIPFPDPAVIALLTEIPALAALSGRVSTELADDGHLPAIRITKVSDYEAPTSWEATPVYQVEIWSTNEFEAGSLAWAVKNHWPTAKRQIVGDALVHGRWIDTDPFPSPDPETDLPGTSSPSASDSLEPPHELHRHPGHLRRAGRARLPQGRPGPGLRCGEPRLQGQGPRRAREARREGGGQGGMTSFRLDDAALAQLLAEGESHRYFAAIGREVRDRARVNARAISPKNADAIISVPGQDDQGIYVDVGYSKHHPGFYLWWWEFGTKNHAARPHLRPALRPHG